MSQRENVDKLLAEGFKELVLIEPIEKITIKEITDKAGVIRPTFYNHFQDKYELLEWILKEELLSPIIPLLDGGFFKEGYTLIFTRLEKEKQFYTKAARLEGQNSFESIVHRCICDILLQFIVARVGEHAAFHNWLKPENVAHYYAQSMTFVVMNWIRTGMTLAPEEVAEVYIRILNSTMDDLLSSMK